MLTQSWNCIETNLPVIGPDSKYWKQARSTSHKTQMNLISS